MWVVWKLVSTLNLTSQINFVVTTHDNEKEEKIKYLPAYKTYKEAVEAYPYEKIYFLDLE